MKNTLMPRADNPQSQAFSKLGKKIYHGEPCNLRVIIFKKKKKKKKGTKKKGGWIYIFFG
jgi:hypothetical protein